MTAVWETVAGMKNSKIDGSVSVGQLLDALDSSAVEKYRDKNVMDLLQTGEPAPEDSGSTPEYSLTIGDIVDFLRSRETLQEHRDYTMALEVTVGDMLEILGEENVKEYVQQKTAEAASKPEFEKTERNIISNWLMLGVFILVFAMLATIALEMIDKDKR